ncbi:MAG: polysaccharide deacetylase family protein [Oscillospiraceae bacterium]|jgi:peptidoglycan/xylan/chitin deacetylase (PgdA/CDA1 family)|nr:polysaccharide deacetylase family protein [Oscillospiraceae bacterium]
MYLSIKIHRVFLFVLSSVLLAGCFCGGTVAAVRQAEKKSGVPLPILMYHSVLRESRLQGAYVVSPQTLESDFVWLKENGYHTVVVRDLLDYVNGRAPLPEKPVMVTFDDGFYNNYYYAYPIAEKYHAKIIISPVGFYTDQYTNGDADHPNYSYLTWGEIEEMSRSGVVEIQNHSYQMHSTKGRYGSKKRKRESKSAYQAALSLDLSKMQAAVLEHTGQAPTSFVYPFGAVSKESVPVLREVGFQSSMNCMEKINFITHDPECLFGLGRYLRPAGLSSDAYFQKIGLK